MHVGLHPIFARWKLNACKKADHCWWTNCKGFLYGTDRVSDQKKKKEEEERKCIDTDVVNTSDHVPV